MGGSGCCAAGTGDNIASWTPLASGMEHKSGEGKTERYGIAKGKKGWHSGTRTLLFVELLTPHLRKVAFSAYKIKTIANKKQKTVRYTKSPVCNIWLDFPDFIQAKY